LKVGEDGVREGWKSEKHEAREAHADIVARLPPYPGSFPKGEGDPFGARGHNG
jgi:hypothetical protein